MADTEDKDRALLSLKSPATGELVPVRLLARETISELFRFEVDAMARDPIDAKSMLNQPACLSVNFAEKPTRHFNGIIAQFGPAGHTPLETRYRLVLVPQLAQAGLQIDCRLFFKVTAKEIIETVLTDVGVTDIEFRLGGSPPQRKQTAQYNETALHFVTRLMEEEGWSYFFEHSRGGHKLVITDHNNGFLDIEDAKLRPGVEVNAQILRELHKPAAITHGKVTLKDYDPDAPKKELKASDATSLAHGGVQNRPVFHWPALTRDTGEVAKRAKLRQQAAEAAVSLIRATGTLASLYAGGKFELEEERSKTKYVVRHIEHLAENEDRRPDTGPISYVNSFTAFPVAVPWRQPMVSARPRMEGLHTAIVLAPSGEEIHTDDQGRIKVRFFWDWRQEATADNSDWVRVVQPWGGNQWGGQFIPRVDTEVAVAFMDADPDRPVVVGGLYNGNDKPIFPVAEKTKTGFRSRSVLKGGTSNFNELSFDDKKGSEMVFVHAEKDMQTEIENDQTLIVQNDRTVTITGNETVTLEKGNQSTQLKMGNMSTVLDMGNMSTQLKMGNVTTKADLGSITMEAMQSITLKVGQSSITIDQTGITLKGMMVSVQGQIQTEVKGVMVNVKGDAMLMLKGGITMIG
ncbi:MAG: type VI secretion system tip protein TssI/VgrG [Reyranellaceae bacterium]